MKKHTLLATLAAFATPLFAVAAALQPNLEVVRPYSNAIINFINTILVPVLIALAFLVFLWGVYKYFFWNGESDTERAAGRQFILWGVIGFVVIFSLWGLVNILGGALGFDFVNPAKAPPAPTI